MEKQALQATNALSDQQKQLLKMAETSAARTNAELERQVTNLKTLIDIEADRQTKAELLKELYSDQSSLLRQQIREIKDQAAETGVLSAADKTRLKDLKKQQEAAEMMSQGQKDLNSLMSQQNKITEKLQKGMGIFAAAANEGALSVGKLGLNLLDIGMQGIMSKILSTVIDLVMEMDKLTKAFERQFQMGPEYTQSIKDQYAELNEFGVSIEDATKAQSTLIEGFTDFTMQGKESRDMLTKTSAILGELGVAQEDFAQGIQNATKMFGRSVVQAEEDARSLMAVARELGVAPGQMAAQYAKMGPQLAKFGREAVDTFKELARVQKITGMEMEKILSITNRFDTFEGAAEQAGQLNAALGGNFVNAMDLMMATDPTERFDMIRDSILNAGLTFDDMSYYQKQFYAEALGLSDVGDLALMLSGDMDALGGATEKSAEELEAEAEQAKAVMDIQQQLTAVLAENADEFMELAEAGVTMAKAMLEMAEYLPLLIKGYIALRAVLLVATIAQFAFGFASQTTNRAGRGAIFTLAGIAAAFVLIAAAMMIFSPSKLVIAMIAFAGSLFLLSRVGEAGAVGLNLLIGPMLAIGAAVFMAASGVALMALAFQGLDPAQIIGVVVALTLFGVGLYFIIPALISAGAAAVTASPGLAILSGVILAIGASVFMAAAGVALMGLGLAEMFKYMDVEKMAMFTVFVGVLVLGAPYFTIAGAGLLLMAAGTIALALGLAMIKTADLEAISTFTESLANIELDAMRELVSLIQEVAQGMEDMPTDQAIALTGTMDAAAAAAQAAEILVRGGGLERGGGTGGASPRRGTRETVATINLTFSNEMFEDKVVRLVEDEYGELLAEAARNEA